MGGGRAVRAEGPLDRELDRLASEQRARFHGVFEGAGEPRLFFAPGRVNLMGAHLDYNGGAVMPTAIDRGTVVAVRPRDDRRVRLASIQEPETLETTLDALPGERTGSWMDYAVGVVRDLLAAGVEARGVDLLVGGNLPVGAGLSSSASVTVGVAVALDALWGAGLDARRLIEAALHAEREFVGVQCGIMDPFAVMLSRAGHLLWIDCHEERVEHLPFESGAGEVRIAIADTGVRRELARGAFNERVAECGRAFEVLRGHQREARCLAQVRPEVLEAHADELGAAELLRARHVLAEVARTQDAKAALRSGDLVRFGRNMTAAHASLRDLYEVSVPELDVLVEAALSWDGVLGTRLTGAGFGGCIVALLDARTSEGFSEHIARDFRDAFGREPVVRLFGAGGGPRELR